MQATPSGVPKKSTLRCIGKAGVLTQQSGLGLKVASQSAPAQQLFKGYRHLFKAYAVRVEEVEGGVVWGSPQ